MHKKELVRKRKSFTRNASLFDTSRRTHFNDAKVCECVFEMNTRRGTYHILYNISQARMRHIFLVTRALAFQPPPLLTFTIIFLISAHALDCLCVLDFPRIQPTGTAAAAFVCVCSRKSDCITVGCIDVSNIVLRAVRVSGVFNVACACRKERARLAYNDDGDRIGLCV